MTWLTHPSATLCIEWSVGNLRSTTPTNDATNVTVSLKADGRSGAPRSMVMMRETYPCVNYVGSGGPTRENAVFVIRSFRVTPSCSSILKLPATIEIRTNLSN